MPSSFATGTGYPRPQPVPAPVEDDSGTSLPVNEIALIVTLIGAVIIGYALPFRSTKYVIAFGFGLLMLAQTTRRPALGLAMLVFSVPALALIPPNMIPIRALNSETFLVGFALYIWHRSNVIYGREKNLNSIISSFLGIYCVLILVSCVRSWSMFNYGLFDVFAMAKQHMSYMIFMPVAFHALRDKRDQRLLVFVTMISLFLNSLQAINHSWFAFVVGALERRRASASIASQPNIFGGCLALYLPMLCVFALHGVNSKRKFSFWYGLFAVSAGFALILTLSRGAWLGAAAGLALVAVVRSRRLLVMLLILGISSPLWLPGQARDRVKETTNIKSDDPAAIADNSTQMRIEQYKSLPAMMAPHPVIGWGYRSYKRVFKDLGTLKRSKGPHSTYVQIATEEGVVGLAILMALWASILWVTFRATRLLTDPFHRWLAVGALGGAASMVVSMASGARFEPQIIFAYFWLIVGIVERELRIAERDGKEPAARLSVVN